jgi:hypothetical protein
MIQIGMLLLVVMVNVSMKRQAVLKQTGAFQIAATGLSESN